jgi:hypothetical protein
MTTCAAFSKESRMRFVNATKLDRKSGGAKPRDLQFHLIRNEGKFQNKKGAIPDRYRALVCEYF